MNLIEQLGGYEKAKEILSNCPQYYHEYQPRSAGIYESGYYRDSAQNRISMVSLKKALLQYRRQHNIFEKGDWLVNTETGTIGDFIKCIDLESGNKHCFVDIGLSDPAVFCMKNIRHLTDAEIETRKRLEV